MKFIKIVAPVAFALVLAACGPGPGEAGGTGPAETQTGQDKTAQPAPSETGPAAPAPAEPAPTEPGRPAAPTTAPATPPADTNETAPEPGGAAAASENQAQPNADSALADRVRQAISQNEPLAASAKNIKITAADGKVTLEGQVKNAQEKQQIVNLVQGVEGVSSVDDQLEVNEGQQQ